MGEPYTKGLCIGRIVHAVIGGKHLAAIVTQVHDKDEGNVDLVIFGMTPRWVEFGSAFLPDPRPAPNRNTWHWPERED